MLIVVAASKHRTTTLTIESSEKNGFLVIMVKARVPSRHTYLFMVVARTSHALVKAENVTDFSQ